VATECNAGREEQKDEQIYNWHRLIRTCHDAYAAARGVLQRLHAGGVPVPAREAVYVVETGDVVVHCADGPGQAFVEAEVTTYIWCQCMETMDVHRLTGNKAHDIPAFLCLSARAPTKVDLSRKNQTNLAISYFFIYI
jgi:hypothetical protein